MPLIYPESLVKIFQLEVGEIAAHIQQTLSANGRMDDRNARAGHTIRPFHLWWSGLKMEQPLAMN